MGISKFNILEEIELNFPAEGKIRGKIIEILGNGYYKVMSTKSGYTVNVFNKDLKKIEKSRA